MQWASSTTSSEMRPATEARTRLRNCSFARRSGEIKQDVHLIGGELAFDRIPVVAIVRVDRLGPETHALRSGDLVAHQRQQGGDQQGRPKRLLAQQLGGDEIHRALAPTGFLHHQKPPASIDDMPDGVFLIYPGIWQPGSACQASAAQGRAQPGKAWRSTPHSKAVLPESLRQGTEMTQNSPNWSPGAGGTRKAPALKPSCRCSRP